MPVKVQDKYDVGIPGQVMSLKPNVIEGSIEGTMNGETGVLKFGVAVVRSTTYPQLVLPSSATTLCVGITVLNYRIGGDDYHYEEEVDTSVTIPFRGNKPTGKMIVPRGYPPNSLVSRLTRGDIMVWTEKAVDPWVPVYYRFTGENRGYFTDTDSAEHTELPNSFFKYQTTAAGAALLSFNDQLPLS